MSRHTTETTPSINHKISQDNTHEHEYEYGCEHISTENVSDSACEPQAILDEEPKSPNPNSNLEDHIANSHINLLTKKKLITVLAAMSSQLLISFIDQSSVSVALPHIASDLNCSKTISWAGTAPMVSNTIFQVLFGRLSDIFGRKKILILCMLILSLSELLCGFAKTGIQYYIFRACCGIGNGGIQSLTSVIVSDIVKLQDRGKYQGILASMVGLGQVIGPFVMSAFITHLSWRDFYYMLSPTIVISAVIIYSFVPNTQNTLSTFEKFKYIDYIGLLFSSASSVLLLVAVNSGGVLYSWKSYTIIIMFVIGGLCFIAFLLIEWKQAKIPMIPLRLFNVKKNLSLSILLYSNFLFGFAYYSFQYYSASYYFQIIKSKSSVMTSLLVMPLVLIQSFASVASGYLISMTNHYYSFIILGYSLWFISTCLLLLWNYDTKDGVNIGVLLIMGVGVGFTFQPTMVAAQAQSKLSDRAVVISTRNVIRSFGGATGIAMGSLIISNTMLEQINSSTSFSSSFKNYFKDNIFTRISYSGLSNAQIVLIRKMYMKSLKNLFYVFIPLIGCCLISSFFIRDKGLQSLDERGVKYEDAQDEEKK